MNRVTLSTGKDDWETPQDFFDAVNREFAFTLDVCASEGNAKCARYYTPEQDGLKQDWQGETVWCNPPYSNKKPGQAAWIQKCFEEAQKPGTTCVMLIPARTDTRAFHAFIYHRAEIRFLRGRLRFGGAKYAAPFPSMLVVFGAKQATAAGKDKSCAGKAAALLREIVAGGESWRGDGSALWRWKDWRGAFPGGIFWRRWRLSGADRNKKGGTGHGGKRCDGESAAAAPRGTGAGGWKIF